MNKRILVVDDEPDIVKTLTMALESAGFDIITASCGAEAIEKIFDYRPDLAVIDMVLPGMSGKDVARWVRGSAEHKNMPIILITALAQKHEKDALEQEGVDCCLIKPFDLEQLLEKVGELCLKRKES